MIATAPEAIYRPLGDGLVLRTLHDNADLEGVAALNAAIHGPMVGVMARSLIEHFPGMEGRDVIFVEDERTHEIVSSILLIATTLRYEGVRLLTGEMGLVGTLEPYRRRGLVRAQVAYFKERLRERGCLISNIQGIPYYYRQFGYEYALPLEGGLRLTRRDLPPPPETPFTFRLATAEDVPLLARCFDAAVHDLAFGPTRSPDEWRYLLTHNAGSEMESETWWVETGGAPAGYFRLPAHHFGDELAVNEASRLSYDAALAVLHRVAAQADATGQPGVRLNLPANHVLMRAARSYGAHDLGTYAWQIHLPDIAGFLRAIGPALEQRIAVSPFAGLTCELPLCFFRDSVRLEFAGGRLMQVTAAGPAEGEINLPGLTFIPLVLGQKSVEELRAAYPDVHAGREWRLLLETLFPRMAGFIYSPY
jgi:hypothetical protein